MNKNISKGIINQISGFKVQLILNRNLYIDEVITKEYYEYVENTLMEKIKTLSNELELNI